MMGLTKRQSDCLDYLRAFKEEFGVIPSYDELAKGLGFKSRSRVKQVLDDLVERGAIRRLSHRARAIELVDPEGLQTVLLNKEIYSLLRAYAAGMKIGVDTAAGELLRGALGAA